VLSPTELAFQIIDALDHTGAAYLFDNPFSSSFYGRPVSTMSADVILDLTSKQWPGISDGLAAGFRVEPSERFEGIESVSRHVVHHLATSIKINLFPLSDDPHDQERFRRRQDVDFEGRRAWLPSAEDVVITKLRWSRGGRRAKDVEDVTKILAVRGAALDHAYIRQWADRHGTRELFDRMLAAALARSPQS
jgi:hypothetical protein